MWHVGERSLGFWFYFSRLNYGDDSHQGGKHNTGGRDRYRRDRESHFGHVKSGMLRSIQAEMQSSHHIVKSGVQGSRVGRLAGERGVVERALGRRREREMQPSMKTYLRYTHKKARHKTLCRI